MNRNLLERGTLANSIPLDSHLPGPRDDFRTQRGLLLALLFLIGSVLSVYISQLVVGLDEIIIWGSIGLALYLAFLLAVTFPRSRYFGLFDLRFGGWFLAYACVGFGIATTTVLNPRTGSAAMVPKTQIPTALVLIGLAFTAWAIGYQIGRARALQNPVLWARRVLTAPLTNSIRKPEVLIAVFALGFAGDALTAFLTGSYGYLGDASLVTVDSANWYAQPLNIISGLKYVALFGLAARVFILRLDRLASFLLPTLAFAIAIGMLTGMKESFVTVMVSAGVPFLLGNSRWRIPSILGVVLVFMFVVTPIVGGFRQDVRGNGALDLGSALSLGVEKVFSADGYLLNPSETANGPSTLERVRLIDNVAIIIERTPGKIPYRSFDELVSAPVSGMVPRLLWPDKPIRLSGYEFYKQYYEGQGQSSSAITLQGSLLLYGGVGVLFVGMIVVGMAMRVLDEVLDARHTLLGALFFTMIFAKIVKQELDVASFLAGFPVFIISWLLGAFLIFKLVPMQTAKEKRGLRRA
jgi:hypothetical protein